MAKLTERDNFYSKKSYRLKDVKYLIDTSEEESYRLEFKSAGSLEIDAQTRKEIGKDVSAFANSDGGLIFYGIKESSHVASEISPVDGKKVTKEMLEHIIASNTSPSVPVKIYPIRIGGKISETVYVVQVPASNIPHMSKDNRYYARRNFESKPMEEYEVKGLYNRISKSKLKIVKMEANDMPDHQSVDRSRLCHAYLAIFISNVGTVVEKDYKLKLSIPTDLINKRKFSGPTVIPLLDQYTSSVLNGYEIYDIPNSSPIFQGEVVTAFKDVFKLILSDWESIKNPIIATLLYTNGVDEVRYAFDSKKQILVME